MVSKGVKRVKGESWYLPHWLPSLLCEANGGVFDLDPCGNQDDQAPPIARRRLAATDNGIAEPWKGTVFLNPQGGCGTIEAWTDKALRAVYWDKSAKVVVALLPVQTDAGWWTSHVRGWASVFLIRSRVRVGRDWPAFGSALTIWGDATPFRTVLERQPKAVVDGVWLTAYRAESNNAPFLRSLTTRAKMSKLYGNYESFRDNLAAWTARVPPEYAEAVALISQGNTPQNTLADDKPYRLNSQGYITHFNGKPLYKRKRVRQRKKVSREETPNVTTP
ncbi:MAG: hypothetical protein HQL37_06090 [Alphaproteobacteria bacterium]|nr:hypothetical protein [Alphaproteobacteria bacterium]